MSETKIGVLLRKEFSRSYVGSGILCDLERILGKGSKQNLSFIAVTTAGSTEIPDCVDKQTLTESSARAGVGLAKIEHEVLSWRHSKDMPAIKFRLRNMLYPRLRQHLHNNLSNFATEPSPDQNKSFAESNVELGDTSRAPWGGVLPLFTYGHRFGKAIRSIVFWASRNFLKRPALFALGRVSLLYIPFKLVVASILGSKSRLLSNELAALNLELLLIPSGGLDPFVSQLLRASKRIGLPTFLLADNWDQMGSKATFPIKPDFLGLIGPQSKAHAIDFLKFDAGKTFAIGCSSYSHYTTEVIADVSQPSDSEAYILFLGSALRCDEMKVLLQMQEILEQHPAHFDGWQIIYKPHPLRQDGLVRASSRFRRIRLDAQYLESVSKNVVESRGIGDAFSLNYYPKLIGKAKFVVSTPTSMILEASILEKETIVLANEEKSNPTSPSRIMTQMPHLHGIENLPNIVLCPDLGRLEQLMVEIVSGREVEVNNHSSHTNLSHFLSTPPGGYTTRLAAVIAESLDRI